MRLEGGRGSLPVLVVLVGTVLLGYLKILVQGNESAGIDFYQFWAVGRAVAAQPGLDPYSDESRRGIPVLTSRDAVRGAAYRLASAYRQVLETYSSPLLYASFSIWATPRYDRDCRAYQLVSTLVFLCGMLLLLQAAGHGWLTSLGVIAFVLEWNEPLHSEIGVAGVNRIQIGMLALAVALLGRRSPFATMGLGATLAAAVLFKPNLLAAPLLLGWAAIVHRRTQWLAQALLGATLSIAAALAFSAAQGLPLVSWSRWVAAVRALPDTVIPLELGNLALGTFLSSLAGPGATTFLGGLAIAAAGAAIWRARSRAGGAADDQAVIALGALVYLMSGRLVWIHYFMLALPAIVLALRPAAPPPVRLGGAFALMAFAVRPWFLLVGRIDPKVEAALFNAAVVLLFVLLLWSLTPASPRPRSDVVSEAA